MKSLNTYVIEGLEAWSDDKLNKKMDKQTSEEAIKQEIIDWIVNNANGKIYKRKLKFNLNTTPITIDYNWSIDFNRDIDSLTNGIFQWGEVSGCFKCNMCTRLESLEGCPKKVGRYFSCRYCDSLTSLEGAPKEVGGYFSCRGCHKLTSLKGAPEKVGEYFNCDECESLKSLKGAPKEVGGEFYCMNCGSQFTEDDVKKVSNIKGKIICNEQ